MSPGKRCCPGTDAAAVTRLGARLDPEAELDELELNDDQFAELMDLGFMVIWVFDSMMMMHLLILALFRPLLFLQALSLPCLVQMDPMDKYFQPMAVALYLGLQLVVALQI